MVPRSLCIKLTVIFAIVGLSFEFILGACIERDDQIQKYLTSSKPPFHNYFNISRAVYPSVNLPSSLIDITVKFLKTAGANSNGSSCSNTSKENVSRSTIVEIRKFKWSMSCLYVSGGEISLISMNWFSLGAIFPNRRQSELHIALPEFCRHSPEDNNDTMIYFLSTLQDLAISPLVFDPSRNTVECVIPDHEKAPHFPGLKKLLRSLCWILLYVSLVMSTFSSQWVIKKLRTWNKEKMWNKTATVMISSVTIFLGGLTVNIWALAKTKDLYVGVFLGCTFIVLFRRVIWCAYIYKESNLNICAYLKDTWPGLTSGHGYLTSRNLYSCVFLYPAIFMACHHLLWILLGIITEPFWGFTILVAVIAVCAIFFFLLSELYDIFPAPNNYEASEEPSADRNNFVKIMSVIRTFAVLSAFVLLLLVFFAVAQVFLSESLISTLVQIILTFVVTAWFGCLRVKGGKVAERNNQSGGGGEGDVGLLPKTS